MKDWVLSDSGDKWFFTLDVGDLGGHLGYHLSDARCHSCSCFAPCTDRGCHGLAIGYFLVSSGSRVPSSCLGCCMVLRLPLSLSVSSLQRLRSAFVAVIWSRRMPLAHTCAVLILLDGPAGSDLVFHVVWCGFRFFSAVFGLWTFGGQEVVFNA